MVSFCHHSDFMSQRSPDSGPSLYLTINLCVAMVNFSYFYISISMALDNFIIHIITNDHSLFCLWFQLRMVFEGNPNLKILFFTTEFYLADLHTNRRLGLISRL